MNEIDFLLLASSKVGVKREKKGTEMAGMIKNEGKFPVIILFVHSLICLPSWQLIEIKIANWDQFYCRSGKLVLALTLALIMQQKN
mgnify:CR=1 FL=1